MSAGPSRFSRTVTHVRDLVFLSSLIAGFITVAGGLIFQFVWPHLVSQLKVDLDVATRADLAVLQAKLDSATGEDRIIRMPLGHSYVSEPVSKGEPINLNMVMARTQKGMACVFVSGTPIFKDSRDIPFAGEPFTPIKQLTLNPERMIINLEAPDEIQPGRVSVALNLRFACPFGADGATVDVYEEAEAVFFQLDPVR